MLKIIKSPEPIDPGDVVFIPDIVPLPGPPDRQAEEPGEEEAPAPPREEWEAEREEMMREARQKAEQAAQAVRRQAGEERDAILAQARSEAERLKQEAVEAGREEGRLQKAEEVDTALRALNRAMSELTSQHQRFMEGYGERLQDFAVEIAGKILRRQIELDETSMAGLVREAVASIKGASWMTVELSSQMPALIQQMKQEVGQMDRTGMGRVDVAAKDIPPGSCVVETPGGLVDASIAVQLDKLQEYFHRM